MAAVRSSPNDDVLSEILSHLSVRSLLRFRTVSKSWRDVIDSPTFRKLQVHNQINNNNNDDDSVFLLFNLLETKLSIKFLDNGKSIDIDFPTCQKFLDDYVEYKPFVRAIGPANGLICIYHKPKTLSWVNLPIAICNPSLGEIKILPRSPLCSSFSNSNGEISREIGIGFDYDTQDYKVVQILSGINHGPIQAEVYSRSINSWRELSNESIPLDHELFIYKHVKSWGKNASFAYWQGFRRKKGEAQYEYVLVSFDMKNEVFETIAFASFHDMFRLGLSRGKIFAKDDGSFLLFFKPGLISSKRLLYVYELKRDGNKVRWNFVTIVGPFRGLLKPMALWKSDCLVLRLKNSLKTHEGLVFYDYSAREFIACFEVPLNCPFSSFQYQSSFISP